jgi:NADPH-dependent ferric siderophore reductase
MQDEIKRIRHELRQRRLTVLRVIALGPHMHRIVFGGDDLADFTSLSPDDHVKLFFPTVSGGAEARDYTPRHYDPQLGNLTIDFALHEAGPATHWARNARIGEQLVIGGPKGSVIIPDVYDWWLLIGDETALPSIGRRVEETPSHRQVMTLVAVQGPEDEQQWKAQCPVQSYWVHRSADQADQPDILAKVLRSLPLPPGKGFVWIAAEARVARALRDLMTQERGHSVTALKAAGYWVSGQADSHDKLDH